MGMYVKCGGLVKSRETLNGSHLRDTVTWNVLLTRHVKNGDSKEALSCFEQMQSDGVSPDAVTYSCILKACGIAKTLEKGRKIHEEINCQGLLAKDVVLGTALVDMYARCGAIMTAEKNFRALPIRNTVSWNVLITGYVQHGQNMEALRCFKEMQREGVSWDSVTFICILKASGNIQDIETGKGIHDAIVRKGLLEKDATLGNCLIDMYARCGALECAKQVLGKLCTRNVVSWSALIAGYVHLGKDDEALICFGRMRNDGISPNAVTFISLLKACRNTAEITIGKQIHDEVAKQGLLKSNVVLGTALLNMYVRCCEFGKAERVLHELPYQDTVSCNTIIAGYIQNQQYEEALNFFNVMHNRGTSIDAKTFGCILKVCGIIGFIQKGAEIHDQILKLGLLKNDFVLATALVDMYIKCGALFKAEKVFANISVRDVMSWNTLIAGYAQHGQGKKALNCFQCMQREGLCPNDISLISLLNACSHSGLVIEGEMCYVNMHQQYGLLPCTDHHTCMVDLFGRAGNFEKAITLIKNIPSFEYSVIWDAVLGACQKWVNVELGRFAFRKAVQLDNSNTPSYILMTNIYAAADMHKYAKDIIAMREKCCF